MSIERFNLDEGTRTGIDFKMLYISTSRYEGDWQSLPHTHHFTELFYVIRGKGSFLVENETITVAENDLVVVNPHVEHTEMSLDAQPLEYVVFGVEGLSYDFMKEQSLSNYGLLHYTEDQKRTLNFSQLILREISEKRPGYEFICHAVLEMLLIYIARSYRMDAQTQTSEPHMSKECAAAKRYLDNHYAQNITLDSLADATHINKYYLAHTFTGYLGMSPINYLTQKRLSVAMELLTSTNHSIAEIASSTGFVSQSYFSQAFKKSVGMAPLQYRKQNHHGSAPGSAKKGGL